jgi:stress-induced morphogen
MPLLRGWVGSHEDYVNTQPPAGLRTRDANLLSVQVTDQVRGLLEDAFPGGEVEVWPFSGDDHLATRIRSDRFSGLSLIDQHKLVYAPVQHLLDDGTIHALQIKTEAP